LDLVPLPVEASKRPEIVNLYPEWPQFNKIQTRVFKPPPDTDDNVFFGAPTRRGKRLAQRLHFFGIGPRTKSPEGPYTLPFQGPVDQRYPNWKLRLSKIDGGK